jgi:hypothetical protein
MPLGYLTLTNYVRANGIPSGYLVEVELKPIITRLRTDIHVV